MVKGRGSRKILLDMEGVYKNFCTPVGGVLNDASTYNVLRLLSLKILKMSAFYQNILALGGGGVGKIAVIDRWGVYGKELNFHYFDQSPLADIKCHVP